MKKFSLKGYAIAVSSMLDEIAESLTESIRQACSPPKIFFNGNVIFFILFFVVSHSMMAQRTDFCGIRNTSSRSGERLTYKVYYTLAGVYVPAGEAIFSNQVEMLQKKPVYHVTGFGRTYSSYDWIYKVRDTYESYIDTTTLLPYQFIRTVNEGGKHDIDRTTFAAGKAVSQNATIKTPDCIQDVLSAIYYARNIDFNQYPIGEKIPFNMYLDDEVFPVYIRYLGKEKFGVSITGEQSLIEVPGCSKAFINFETYLNEKQIITPILKHGLMCYFIPINSLLDNGLLFFKSYPEKLLCTKGRCPACDFRRNEFLN